MPDRDCYNRTVERSWQKAARTLYGFEESAYSTRECASRIGGLIRDDDALRAALLACIDTLSKAPRAAHADLERIVRSAGSPYIKGVADRVLLYLSDSGLAETVIPDGVEQASARFPLLADILTEIVRASASPMRLQLAIGKPGSQEQQHRLNTCEANLDAFRRSQELAGIAQRLLQDVDDSHQRPPSTRRPPRPSQEELVYAALPT